MEYTSRQALALHLGISHSDKGLCLKCFIDNPFHLAWTLTADSLKNNLKTQKEPKNRARAVWSFLLSSIFRIYEWVGTRTPSDYIYPRNNKKFQNYLCIRNLICSDYSSRSIALGVIHLHWYFLKLFQLYSLPLLLAKTLSQLKHFCCRKLLGIVTTLKYTAFSSLCNEIIMQRSLLLWLLQTSAVL